MLVSLLIPVTVRKEQQKGGTGGFRAGCALSIASSNGDMLVTEPGMGSAGTEWETATGSRHCSGNCQRRGGLLALPHTQRRQQSPFHLYHN